MFEEDVGNVEARAPDVQLGLGPVGVLGEDLGELVAGPGKDEIARAQP